MLTLHRKDIFIGHEILGSSPAFWYCKVQKLGVAAWECHSWIISLGLWAGRGASYQCMQAFLQAFCLRQVLHFQWYFHLHSTCVWHSIQLLERGDFMTSHWSTYHQYWQYFHWMLCVVEHRSVALCLNTRVEAMVLCISWIILHTSCT